MRAVGFRARRARTLAGQLRYVRTVYECGACRGSHAPLDVEFNLGLHEQMTRGLVRKAAYAGAIQSFASGSKMLWELAGLSVSPAEIARVAHAEGRALQAAQQQRDAQYLRPVSPEAPAPPPEIVPEKLVLQADATCVLTLKGEEHKSVYCAVGFDLAARGRDAGDRPFVAQKRYAASAGDMEQFAARAKALAYRAGLRQAKKTAFLGDGARSLWNWAQDALPKDTVFIQDFWHVCEHLSALASDLFGAQDDGPFQRWKQWLRQSQVQRILDELEQLRKRHRGAKRKRIDEERTYLRAGASRMDYAAYEAQGWPIGSGAIEGACKHLVKQRFALTGAHWRRKNIGDVLALREAIFNDHWDQHWQRPAQAA